MALNDVQPTATAAAYKAKKIEGPLPEYDAMRQRLQQRTTADTQQQQDAMQRRFAAQGGLNSGASLKQQQLISETGVQNREQGLQDIGTQESAEQRRLKEAEDQKEFQSQEAAAGRSFQAGESQLGRDFQANESRMGRDLSKYQFDSNQAFTDKWNVINQSNTIRQLDLAAQESAFNQASAAAQMSDDERQWLRTAQGGHFDINSAMEQVAREKGDRERAKQRVQVKAIF